MSQDALNYLSSLIGADNVRTDTESLNRALSAWCAPAVKRRRDGDPHLPLAVALPGSVEEVAALVRWANETRIPLHPTGGVSSVVEFVAPGAVYCAVDLCRLDSVTWDEESLLVTAGAGCALHRLEEQLNQHGYTLGHLPVSLRLMTVGGSVATNAVGLLSGKYGRQADLLAALEAVLPDGEMVRTLPAPGADACFPLHSLFVGTEGQFGIITEATLRMYPMPEARAWAVFAFPSLGDAMDAARLIYRSDARPTLLRIFDSVSAQLLHPSNALLIAGFEGDELVQTGNYQLAYAVCQQVNGTPQSPEIGDAWFERRHELGWLAPNARDGGLADIFALSAPWSLLRSLEAAVRQAVQPMTESYTVQICHPTPQGAALEVCWQARTETGREADLYERVAHTGYLACLEAGGVVAHHYGVGRTRWPFLRQQRGASAVAIHRALKAALDPNHILNPGGLP